MQGLLEISSFIHKTSAPRKRKIKFYLLTTNDPVCVEQLERFIFSRDTLKKLFKKVSEQPTVKESLLPAESADVLELDEIWSFVFIKTAKYWLWTALCRRNTPNCGICDWRSER